MTSSPSERLYGATNELAKERNRAAAERTLNAWIGNCLGAIGFGIASDQIYEVLAEQFPDTNSGVTAEQASIFGLFFIAIGIILLVVALLQHRLAIKTIERDDYISLSVTAMNRVAMSAIILFGIVGGSSILLFF